MVWGDHVIFEVYRNGVVAFGRRDGRRAWAHRFRAALCQGYVYDGRYWALTTMGDLVVFEPSSGRVLLERNLKRGLPKKLAGVSIRKPLLVSETHVFTGSHDGYVLAFDRQTGNYVWRHRAKGGASTDHDGSYFASANGRLYYSDVSNRVYCLEEVNPTDPVLRSQRLGTATVALDRAGEEGNDEGEGAPGLLFNVSDVVDERSIKARVPYHVPGGDFTVLRCGAGEATFVLAARSEKKGKGSFEWGEGYLWVPTVEDGDRLLKAVRAAFGDGRGRVRPARRVKPPTPLGLACLGEGVDESGSGKGTWTRCKWTGKDGSPEFYVKWSLAEKRGVITEKDEAYRKDLIALFASLVVR